MYTSVELLTGDVPPGATTCTFTAPVASLPAGAVAVIWVSELTVNCDGPSTVVPKSTAVAPVNPVPVIVTWFPPATPPSYGDTPVTVVGLA